MMNTVMTQRRIGGRYILEQRLAGGGMGTIWMALDTQLQRRVALKLMVPPRMTSAVARQQFEQEARAIAQLQNPHVIQVYDAGLDGESPYIVMELLEGEDLEARITRHGRLAPATVAHLLNQLAKGLTAAHAAGITHRDLKPANLFLARLDTQEVVKVLDFGLALLNLPGRPESTPRGMMVGTPRYTSPEQLRGEARVDPRSDLWSLGVVVYRALTGRFPFSLEAIGALLNPQPDTPPVKPDSVAPELEPALDAFFARALAVDPDQRFQSASEMAATFAALLEKSRPDRPAKILVVDDESDMALLMKQQFRKQLRQALYEFVFATDGEDALEKLRQHPDVDVVLSDINMPRMNGLTFLSRVGEVNPLVKVIMVSAYGDLGNLREAMNRGAFDFVVKPIVFEDLEATLTKTLKHTAELRRVVRSVEENQLLRMFVHEGIAERVLPMVRGPELPDGQREEATVTFLDLADFTSVTHQQRPEAVIRRLNANFEVLVPELTSRGGVVDKFVGDAVMGVFHGPRHLERALEACLAARERLREMAFRYGEHSLYAHGVCIGLDSGELIRGSLGARSLGRLDYTVLGDVVNTAARLASLAHPGELLISEGVHPRVVAAGFECGERGTRSLTAEMDALAFHAVVREPK